MLVRRDIPARRRGQAPCLRVGSSSRKVLAGVLAWIHDRGSQAKWAAVGISVFLFFYAVVYAFPHARLAAQEQERDTVEQESHAFCEKHGMPFGTREHTVCIEDLMDVRANERQRTLADLGIF